MPVLLWVGHMVPVKGLDVLINACALACGRADFRLYLIGSGPLREDLVRQAAALGVTDRVQFVGYVAHDQLGDWYRAADMTVLPSHSEGVPNVLLESIASGTPFVASRVGGVPEIADPLIDRLVAPGNPTALADALVDAIIAPSRLPRRVMPISTEEASTRLLQVLAGVRRSRATQAASNGAWAAPSSAQARVTRT
jgi:glycosyltransferase involved in cell wall biosynthesis